MLIYTGLVWQTGSQLQLTSATDLNVLRKTSIGWKDAGHTRGGDKNPFYIVNVPPRTWPEGSK